MGSDLYMMRGEMEAAENVRLKEKIRELWASEDQRASPDPGKYGVLVTLRDNAQQFLAGADGIKYGDTGWLSVLRSGAVVGIFNSGSWTHAQRIDNFPESLVQDPSTSIWVIKTPEVNNGVPDAHPLPER